TRCRSVWPGRSLPVLRGDRLAERRFCLRARHLARAHGEGPPMALEVGGAVRALAVELLLGFGGDRCPRRPRPLAMGVQVPLEHDVNPLRVGAAEALGALDPLLPQSTDHDAPTPEIGRAS